MKVIFIGSVESSKAFLEVTLRCQYVEVSGVVTKETSKYNSDFVNIAEITDELSIPSFLYTKENQSLLPAWIEENGADLILCLGWSHLLPEKVLSLPRLGTIGYHPAELPQNRGRHPIIWALALGLSQTASTFFYITSGADEGDIISQEIVLIDQDDDATSLYSKLLVTGRSQLSQLLKGIHSGTITSVKQKNSLANSWRKRSKVDGRIDWRMNVKDIKNLIRALSKPYPGAFFCTEGGEVTIWACKALETEEFINIEPGKVVKIDNENWIKCAGGFILPTTTSPSFCLEEGEYL